MNLSRAARSLLSDRAAPTEFATPPSGHTWRGCRTGALAHIGPAASP